MAPNVAIVFGSFLDGDSEKGAKNIKKAFKKIDGLECGNPTEGNDFDFDSLKDCKFLIIVTSSQLGYPPANFSEFAHQLLRAAKTNPGCLSHLQHAVFGYGDPQYLKTYMNNPRYMDLLLEKAGSKRFFVRGENREPCGDVAGAISLNTWAKAMWQAAANPPAEPVKWDAPWTKAAGDYHHNVTEWDVDDLEDRRGPMTSKPSIFAKL